MRPDGCKNWWATKTRGEVECELARFFDPLLDEDSECSSLAFLFFELPDRLVADSGGTTAPGADMEREGRLADVSTGGRGDVANGADVFGRPCN